MSRLIPGNPILGDYVLARGDVANIDGLKGKHEASRAYEVAEWDGGDLYIFSNEPVTERHLREWVMTHYKKDIRYISDFSKFCFELK